METGIAVGVKSHKLSHFKNGLSMNLTDINTNWSHPSTIVIIDPTNPTNVTHEDINLKSILPVNR